MELHLKKNAAAELMFPMVDSTTPANLKNTTVSDEAYYKDGAGAWTSLSITDTATQIGTTGMYTIELTAAEMNHDLIMIKMTGSGAADSVIIIRTFARDVEDLAYPATSGRSLDVDTSGRMVLQATTHTGATVPTVTTLTGHTAQTGDNYARIGAPAGASVSADIAAVKTDTGNIETDTQDLQTQVGTAGAGLTDLGGMSTGMQAEVQSECNDALVAQKLDHLVAVADADDPVNNSIVAKLAASDGDWSGFDNTADSLEAIRDTEPLGTAMRGTDGANTTTPPTVGEIQAEMEENGASILDSISDKLPTGTISDFDESSNSVNLNADQSGVTIGTVSTLTGHTAQTGDNYARLGAPAGASVSADIAAVKVDTGNIETDTQDLQTQVGTAGAGLTDLGGMSTTMKGQVNTEVQDVINTDTASELTAVPAVGAPLRQMIQWLYELGRNKRETTSSADTVYRDNGTTQLAASSISDDATTFTRGEYT